MPDAPSFNAQDLLTKVSFHPVPTAVLVGAVVWYSLAARRCRRRGRPWPSGRKRWFAIGIALLALGLLSGMANYASKSFTMQAIIRLAVDMAAPLAIALSAPLSLAQASAGPRLASKIGSFATGRLAVVISNPVVTWLVYGAAFFALYFTGIYPYTVTHPLAAGGAEAVLFFAGLLFAWPLMAVDPLPRPMQRGFRIVYALLFLPFYSMLGMAIISERTAMVAGISLVDQRTGATIIWTTGIFLGLVTACATGVQWMHIDERETRRRDDVTAATAAQQMAAWRASRLAASQAADSARRAAFSRASMIEVATREAQPRHSHGEPVRPTAVLARARLTGTAGDSGTATAGTATGPAGDSTAGDSGAGDSGAGDSGAGDSGA